MVAQNGYLYALSEDGFLTTARLSDSGKLWFTSRVSLGSLGSELALDGDSLYAALGNEGFVILGLADPAHPAVRVQNSDSAAFHIVAAGSNMFIAEGTTVTRIDVSDAQALQFTGCRTGSKTVEAIAPLSEDRLLVASSAGLEVLDAVAADTLPTIATEATYPPRHLAVDGSTVYANSDGYWESEFSYVSEEGFIVYDLTDPSNPQAVGYHGTPTGSESYLNELDYTGLVPNGTHVYAAFDYYGDVDTDAWGIRVMDVSTPSSPAVGVDALLDTTVTAEVMENGYLIVEAAGVLRVFDLTDPAHPAETSTLSVPEIVTATPRSPMLVQAWPNPFNPSLNIAFTLEQTSTIRLGLVNVLGQTVWSRDVGRMGAGWHRFNIQPDRLSSGVYLLRVSGDAFNAVRKVQLIR